MKSMLEQMSELVLMALAAVGAAYMVLVEWQQKPRLAFSGVLLGPAVGWGLLRIHNFPHDLVPIITLFVAVTAPATILHFHGKTLQDALEDIIAWRKRNHPDEPDKPE